MWKIKIMAKAETKTKGAYKAGEGKYFFEGAESFIETNDER